MTIAKHACDHVLKRVLKQSAYRLQIFLEKYEYLRSLKLCEDQGIRRKLKRNVSANMCLRFLQLIPRPGFTKMHKTFVTVCLLHRRSLVEPRRPSERSERAPARKRIANGCHYIHAAWHALAPQFKNNVNKVQSE